MDKFIGGIIVGMLIAVISMITEIFFRSKKSGMGALADDMEKKINPKGKAYVIMPKTEEEEAVDEIININKKAGKDTKLEEL